VGIPGFRSRQHARRARAALLKSEAGGSRLRGNDGVYARGLNGSLIPAPVSIHTLFVSVYS
jgi:hypothetical protein